MCSASLCKSECHTGKRPVIADLTRNPEGQSDGTVLFTLTFDSSPIKGEGYMVGVVLFSLSPRPVDAALKPVRACATVVASSYSAWRVPALWIAGQVRDDVTMVASFSPSPAAPLDCGSSPQ